MIDAAQWPANKAFTSVYLPGNQPFDPRAWPDGQAINQALTACHDANQAYENAVRALSQEERNTLGLAPR
jgi:hypothetical protein